MEKLLSSKEVAGILGVGEITLSIWRCKKQYPLPYIKAGRAVRYRESDVEAFIASRTHSGI